MPTLYKKGFTMIELLMVIAIIGIISLLSVPKLSDFKKEQSLKNTTGDIMALLNKAKSDSLSSLNSNNYSIHFESDRMIYFVGDTYSSSDSSNEVIYFEPQVSIPSTGGINLNGGGDNVIFSKLAGNVIGYGTIVIQITSDPTRQKIVTIEKTGAISSN
jgi:prepilin-type N-terminal cleavage/methylation domain-containing protein